MNKKYEYIVVLILITISLIPFRNVLQQGYIPNGNLMREPELATFIESFVYTWHPQGSYSTFYTLNQLPFYTPFFIIGTLFNLSTIEVLCIVSIFVEFITGLFMYILIRYLLEDLYGSIIRKKYIIIASFIGALIYM